MADQTVTPPAPRKGRKWLRIVGWIFGLLIVLLVVVYFTVTSSGFLKSFILPRVSKSLNADVTVSDAAIHPFGEIVLNDLKIQPGQQAALLTAPLVSVKYHLFDIIGGNIRVDEIQVVSPTIQVVQNPDGTSNLDPFKSNPSGEKPAQPSGPSKPMQVDLHQLILTNATIRMIQNHLGGTRDLLELTNFNIALENVKNGQTANLQIGAIIRDENNPPAPAMYGLLEATLAGHFTLALTPDLKPGSIQGEARVEIPRAAGAFSDFATLAGILSCDTTPTEIKQAGLRFEKGGERLGEIQASGPFDAEKTEGKLSVKLLSIDRRVLNLLGAQSGMDFGSTAINSTNEIQLTKSGSDITASGTLGVSKFQLIRTNASTPALDFAADYAISVDQEKKTALISTLTLTGVQTGREFMHGELTSPMTFAWGNAANGAGDSSFKLTLNGVNLADWNAYAGNLVSAGILDTTLNVSSRQGGNQILFDVDSKIQNLSAGAGGNQISQAGVNLRAHGQATNLKQFDLSEYNVELSQQNQAMLTLSGSATYDLAGKTADAKTALQISLPRVLQLLGRTDITASSGTVDLKASVTQKQETQTVTGNLALTDFTGEFGKNQFQHFGAAMDLDVAKTPEKIEIRKVAGKLTQGESNGGNFQISGSCGLNNQPTQVTIQLDNFNESGLRPVIQPLLADKKLVSISISGNVSAQYQASGDSTVKADVQVANLVVNDPSGQLPATPLEMKLQADTSMQKTAADIRQFQIGLTPTDRATNQIQMQGHVDFSKTNATQGNINVTANSLDVTHYYDLFSGKKPAPTAKPSPTPPPSTPAPAPPVSQPPEEAPGMTLPLQNFVLAMNIGQLYLHEIEITNLQTTVKLDGGHVQLNPCKFVLNGAPVGAAADVDLSVPGYKYALTANADRIPFAPLWNTFEPDRKGDLGGELSAHADINGTGTTGASLQKTLAGKFDIVGTNLNLSIEKLRSPAIRNTINVVASVPQLLRDPSAGVLTFASSVTGGRLGGSNRGLGDLLNQSPLEVIAANGTAGGGQVELKSATVKSVAFIAQATGTITLAQELTNSTLELPISIWLSQTAMDRIGFKSSSPSTNGYAKLPDFYTEVGTLSNPKTRINKLALGSTALQQFGITGGNKGSGGLLQNLGGVLQGGNSKASQANTNKPASPLNNLLNQFLKK